MYQSNYRPVCLVLWFCFVFSFFMWLCRVACGILVPQPGIKPGPLAVKAPSPRVLTTGPPGNSLGLFVLLLDITPWVRSLSGIKKHQVVYASSHDGIRIGFTLLTKKLDKIYETLVHRYWPTRILRQCSWDFPGSPVVRISLPGPRFHPWSGN